MKNICFVMSLLMVYLFVNSLQGQTLTFNDVTSSTGVNAAGKSFGAAWGDYNDDGFIDLYVTKVDGQSNHLYQNKGPTFDWSFDDVALEKEVNDDIGSGHGVAFGDYDNDGDLDIYIGNHSANLLYTNIGSPLYNFRNDAVDAGVEDPNRAAAGIAWGDYNSDGYLDIYFGNHTHPETEPNKLFKNNGDGTFSDVTSSAEVEDIGHTEGVTFGDYDNDGDLDLFSTNTSSQDYLYQNNVNVNGKFSPMAIGEPSGEESASSGVAFGDYDNDGDLDIYVTNEDWNGPPYGTSRLFQNDGSGVFTDVTASAGVKTDDLGEATGVAWADFDNDGFLDIYISRGIASNVPNILFHNNWDGTFTDIANTAGVNHNGQGRGGELLWLIMTTMET